MSHDVGTVESVMIETGKEETMRRRPRTFESNQKKMHQLIQYISQQCASQNNFGKTKLCKILHFADSVSFVVGGEPITGWEYVRMPYGPYPDNFEYELESMISSGQLQMQVTSEFPGYSKKKPVNIQEPDLTVFSAQEIAIVNYVIREFEDLTGSQLSELSHGGAWKFASQGETIPYESFLLDLGELSPEEIHRGMEVAEEYAVLA